MFCWSLQVGSVVAHQQGNADLCCLKPKLWKKNLQHHRLGQVASKEQPQHHPGVISMSPRLCLQLQPRKPHHEEML